MPIFASLAWRGTPPSSCSSRPEFCAIFRRRSFTSALFLLFICRLVALVSLDDLLNELVTNHVPVGKMNETDTLDAVKDRLHLDEARSPPVREVYLGHIAGDDGLRVETEPREKHLHLLRRGVLRLVEDNEGIVQGPSAHECEGRDLDVSPLHELVRLFRFDHIVERVVQRSQIGVDLFVQISGKEPEFLAGLDRGPHEDDPAHLATEERRDRHSHGQVRFPRAGRADPEHDVVPPDRVYIRALSLVFRRYGPFPAGYGYGLLENVLQGRCGVRGKGLNGVVYVVFVGNDTLVQHIGELDKKPLDAGYRFFVPFDLDAISPCMHIYPVHLLDQSE